jgi:uncharacterized protein
MESSPEEVRLEKKDRPGLAFTYSVPIGVLGGLIGLGGAEFRLPILAGPLGYTASQAVPLNLAISLVTVAASLAIRSQSLTLVTVWAYLPEILALIAGAVLSAFWGAGLARRISNRALERIIFGFLIVIGTLLAVESFLPMESQGLIPEIRTLRIGAGFAFGLVIGLVSSLLGVAGGELIIPTLIFGYGVDIRTAGSASLLISLPTILTGMSRYARKGAFADKQQISGTVAPMGAGSVLGAVIGGLLVRVVPVPALKLMLGVILIISAFRVFHHSKVDP